MQARGQTGAYLELAPGDPSLNIFKMAREGLLYGVRSALVESKKTATSSRREGLRLGDGHGDRRVDVEVIPLTTDNRSPHYLVLFQEFDSASLTDGKSVPAVEDEAHAMQDEQVLHLQHELEATRQYLQSIIQDLEAANEELQSANEEILSSNEELQSTNEELDTAKEELQSTNEELNTVNEELHGRNDELTRANSDLQNLLASVQIAIVMVASDLRIRRFTPMAERILNLIAADVGRPISHIKPNIDCPDLEALISEAIDTVTSKEREVHDSQGHHYVLRVRPYKDVDNRIDGAVLALFDVNATGELGANTARESDWSMAVLDSLPSPVVCLDQDLHVQLANDAFLDSFGLRRSEVHTKRLTELPAFGSGKLRLFLEEAARDGRAAELRLKLRTPHGESHATVSVVPGNHSERSFVAISIVFRD